MHLFSLFYRRTDGKYTLKYARPDGDTYMGIIWMDKMLDDEDPMSEILILYGTLGIIIIVKDKNVD